MIPTSFVEAPAGWRACVCPALIVALSTKRQRIPHSRQNFPLLRLKSGIAVVARMTPCRLDISLLYRRTGTSFATSFTVFVKPPYSAFNSYFIGDYDLSDPRRFSFADRKFLPTEAEKSAKPYPASGRLKSISTMRSRQAIRIRYDVGRLWLRFVQRGLQVAHLSCPCHFSL